MYLTKFRTYKIALPPQTKPRRGGGPQTPAVKSLYLSILKKSRHLGFGVFIDIWSMYGGCETDLLHKFAKCRHFTSTKVTFL